VEQIRPYIDERLTGVCVYCQVTPDTRDHVPPRVFLDEPYPENLPVVPSCRSCNESTSLDEEYVACLLEVAACGSSRPSDLQRPKIARKLGENNRLAQRLARSFESVGEKATIVPEVARVSRVVEKIGRALWSFEIGGPTNWRSAHVQLAPITELQPQSLADFEAVGPTQILPEVGSRAMFRALVVEETAFGNSWLEVQPGRFSYLVECTGDTSRVKMIIRDFLAAQIDLD
jgi:hypothetical protein